MIFSSWQPGTKWCWTVQGWRLASLCVSTQREYYLQGQFKSVQGMPRGSLSYDHHSPPVALPRQRRDGFRKGKRRRSRVQQQQHSQSGKEKLCVIPLSNRNTGSGASGIGARGLTRPSAETVNRVGGSAHKTIDLVSSGRKDLGEHVGNGKCGNQQTRQQKPTLKKRKEIDQRQESTTSGRQQPHHADPKNSRAHAEQSKVTMPKSHYHTQANLYYNPRRKVNHIRQTSMKRHCA